MSNKLEYVGTFHRIRWPDGAHKEENCHWLGKVVEWYFDLGQTSYDVLKQNSDDGILTKKHVAKRTQKQTALKVLEYAFKVLTWLTVVVPLVMLIGKCIYRAENIFVYQAKIPTPKAPDMTTPTPPNIPTPTTPNKNTGGNNIDPVPTPTLTPNVIDLSPNTSQFSRAELEKKRFESIMAISYSKEQIERRYEGFDSSIDSLDLDSSNDIELLRVMYRNIQDQITQMNKHKDKAPAYSVNQSEIQRLEDAVKDFEELIAKLKRKFKGDDRFKELVLELQKESKDGGDESVKHQYVKAVDLYSEIVKEKDDGKSYDVNYYRQVKAEITPTPIGNCGNSCYMNSDLQTLLSIPAIKNMILGEWKSVTTPREDEDSEKEYKKIEASDKKFFEENKARLEQVKQKFVELCDAIETKHQQSIDEAAVELRDAMWNAGLMEEYKTEQMQAERFINDLLSASGFAIKTRKYVYDIEGKKLLNECRVGYKDPMITLSIKEGKRDEPFAFTFQGLVDHEFSKRKITNDPYKIKDEVVNDRQEEHKLLEAPEYMFVQIKRFGATCNPSADFKKYKLRDSLAFPEGDVIDFSRAMDKKLVDTENAQFLYEAVATIEHHGGIDGGHYTATVKKAGEWFHCDDSSPVVNHGHNSPYIEDGYIYVLKRVSTG